MTAGVRCTDNELELLSPIEHLSASLRTAVTDWLTSHGLAPEAIPVGTVVKRDLYAGGLHWREAHHDGTVVRRWRYTTPKTWPAPFPEALRHC